MENHDILISGASIAGPALAYWLRSQGFNPTVVERAPAPRPGGQTVDLRGAGRTVIQRMGLMDRARELVPGPARHRLGERPGPPHRADAGGTARRRGHRLRDSPRRPAAAARRRVRVRSP